MLKENFKVELEDNLLTISAEQKSENTESDEKAKFTRKEFSYSAFKRSFTLDEETVAAENIEAKIPKRNFEYFNSEKKKN